jgi:origin recognition complex subunit 5
LLHFPAYDKAETLAILSLSRPVDVEPEVYLRFVELMWDVFHGPCRVVSELKHLVALLLPDYLQPVEQGELDAHNTMALYRRFTPLLKSQLSRLYLRDVSTDEWKEQQLQQQSDVGASRMTASGRLELPFHAKYLLVSAYLASANPQRTDARYFAKVGMMALLLRDVLDSWVLAAAKARCQAK